MIPKVKDNSLQNLAIAAFGKNAKIAPKNTILVRDYYRMYSQITGFLMCELGIDIEELELCGWRAKPSHDMWSGPIYIKRGTKTWYEKQSTK